MREKDKKNSLKKSGPVEADNTVFPEPLLNKEPCTLTRVCRHWRQVALSTPFLWSHIRVRLGYGPQRTPLSEKRVDAHFRIVSAWLRLSRNVPLMLCLDAYNDWHVPDEISHNLARLKILHIIWPNPSKDDWILDEWTLTRSSTVDTLVGQATSIERLHIYPRNARFSYVGTLSPKNPSLLKHLRHPYPSICWRDSQENSHQCLESLEGDWDVRNCLGYIALFPSLQILRASLNRKGNLLHGEPPYQETISQLKILEIESRSDALKPFLDHLLLPVIKVAVFNIRGSEYDFIRPGERPLTSHLSFFLARTFSTLVELHLPGAFVDEMVALGLLKHSPHLQHLTLGVRTLTNAGLLALELKVDFLEANICPGLVMLRLQSMTDTGISADQVLRTIHSRLERKPILKVYLELRYQSDQEDAIKIDINSSIQELMEQSVLNLTMHYPYPLRKKAIRSSRHHRHR